MGNKPLPSRKSLVLAIIGGLCFSASAPAVQTIILQQMNQHTGIALNGYSGQIGDAFFASDFLGWSVSAIGDINGDGFDDIATGAWSGGPIGGGQGEVFIVFGRASSDTPCISLRRLDGSYGFTINTNVQNSRFGYSVSGGADVNGDGIDDLIAGVPSVNSDEGLSQTGAAIIVFGSHDEFAPIIDIETLDQNVGTTIIGTRSRGRLGFDSEILGDVNGDGFNDIGVGAPRDEASGTRDGDAAVVFGGPGRADLMRTFLLVT